MAEAIWFKLCGHGRVVQHGVVSLLGFGRRDIADGREQASVVEPVAPFERGVLHGFKGSPRTSTVDDLGLVKTVDRLGQIVAIAVTNAADGWLDPSFDKALGIFDRHVSARR